MFPFYIFPNLVSISLFLFLLLYHSFLVCFLSPLHYCGRQLRKKVLEQQQSAKLKKRRGKQINKKWAQVSRHKTLPGRKKKKSFFFLSMKITGDFYFA